jgi:hypothetical protein
MRHKQEICKDQVLVHRFWKHYPAVGFINARKAGKKDKKNNKKCPGNGCVDLPTTFSFKTHHYAPPVIYVIGGRGYLDYEDPGKLMKFATGIDSL